MVHDTPGAVPKTCCISTGESEKKAAVPMKLISHEARKSPNGERKAGHTGRNASRSGPRARNSVKPCAPSLCGGSEIEVGPDGGAGKEGRVTTMTRKAAVALKPAATSNPVRTSACISNHVSKSPPTCPPP